MARAPTVETGPAIEPVTVAEQKAHSNIDHDADDGLVGDLIEMARERYETLTGRALIERTLVVNLSEWPADGVIRLPAPPLSSVLTIKYYPDDGGAQATVSSGDYQVDTGSVMGRVKPSPDVDWPGVETRRFDAIEVRFKAGYGTAASDVPAEDKLAIRMLAAHYYEHREAVLAGGAPPISLPMGVESIALSRRVIEFAGGEGA